MADKPTNREQLKELNEKIEAGIWNVFNSGKFAEYLQVMSRFHTYSVKNQMLIHSQCPNAVKVAGYDKWMKQFGRHVKKGEHGITIIAPTTYKKIVERPKIDPATKAPVRDAAGKVVMEEKEIEVLTFQPAQVFDYSQTEGKPLPQLVSSASRRIQHYEAFMEALQRASPVPLNGELMRENGSENTFARQETGQTQTAEACIRTMARAILQRNEKKNLEIAARDWPEVPIKQISEQIRNIEVEGISYIVCQHFGIETGENSFDCVAADCKHLDILDLESCLETINKTVGSMIFNIEKEFAETQKQEQRQANTAVKEAVEPEKKKSVLEQLKQKIKQERKRTAPRKSAERGL